MYEIWLVGLGGFLGAAARYWVNLTFSNMKLFPLGTFVVNLTGSFLMGLLLGSDRLSVTAGLFLCTGFLGAYTTFSTLHFELLQLHQNRRRFVFFFYLAGSYLCGILLAGLGYWIGEQ